MADGRFYGIFQQIEIVLNHVSDTARVSAEIFVDDAVTDSGYGAPGDIGMGSLEILINGFDGPTDHARPSIRLAHDLP